VGTGSVRAPAVAGVRRERDRGRARPATLLFVAAGVGLLSLLGGGGPPASMWVVLVILLVGGPMSLLYSGS